MKRLTILMATLCLFSTGMAYADEEHRFRLDDRNKPADECTLLGAFNNEICRIGCELTGVDDNGIFNIDVTVENYDDSYYLCYFTQPFTVKDLRKKMRPKVVFTRGFRQEAVRTCSPLHADARGGIVIAPGGKEVFTLCGSEDVPNIEFALPLYFAQKKGKRLALLDVRTEIFQIQVDIYPSESHARLKEAVNTTVDSLARMKYVVCKHKSGKRHYPPLDDQKAAKRTFLDSLMQAVAQERDGHIAGSKRYDELDALWNKLNRIDLSQIPVEDCKLPDPGGCSCPAWVTSMSLRQISYRMEELYLQIHNGEKTKEEVMNEVNVLWTHTGHIKNDPDKLKNGIRRYYNKIKSL